MKQVSANKLNRLWKKGIEPIIERLDNTLKKTDVVDTLLATVKGKALDATQGAALKRQLDELNSKLENIYAHTANSGTGKTFKLTPSSSAQTFLLYGRGYNTNIAFSVINHAAGTTSTLNLAAVELTVSGTGTLTVTSNYTYTQVCIMSLRDFTVG